VQTIYDKRPDIDDRPSRQRKSYPEIRDEEFWHLYDKAKAYSMIHVPGFFNIYQSMQYLKASSIQGALVECGCFLGGSSIFIELCADQMGMADWPIVVFDTFAGFPPDSYDTRRGERVKGPSYKSFREAVMANFREALGRESRAQFIEGDVVQTLPQTKTGPVALMRLDTDFYPSTKAEMDVLYPRLCRGGVLIVDDYGTYEGSRKAVDEYFAGHTLAPLLFRIDGGVFAGIKP